MSTMLEAARARRYLLRQASDEEAAALEQEYFEHPDALDRIAAAEEDLIEDYLSGQLSAADREHFDRAYLSVPHHRIRVETIRRLMANAAQSAPPAPRKVLPFTARRFLGSAGMLALAASILVAAAAALWMLSPFGGRSAEVAGSGAPQPPVAAAPAAAPASAPRVVALFVSPVAVRGASDSPPATIPEGTDVVALSLESDGDARNLTPVRASIQVVGGREVWQGIASTTGLGPGAIARLEVPASALAANDYVITLLGADRAGRESEWAQYFLRVRGR
jgi:hypothetical protein